MAGFSSSADTALNIARGLVSRTTGVTRVGAVPAMSISATGSVWGVNDTPYPWSALSSATTLSIPAVNASDDGETITIVGLDSNWDELTESVTVSSSGATTTTNSFLRVNNVYFTDGGAQNVGNILVQAGGTTVGIILAGQGSSLMGVYSVPRGKNAYITQGTSTIENGGDATVDMWVKQGGTSTFIIAHTFEIVSGSQYMYHFGIPMKAPSMSDIDLRATMRSNNSRVTVAWDMYLIEE